MNIIETEFNGLYIIEPKIFEDERGHFYESYNQEQFIKKNININFVQDNQSLSHKNVLRGLHYQNEPYGQDKLVRVIRGSVIDVAVDIRPDSPTYGKHKKILLSGVNKISFLIPKGFAHGFITLEDNTIFSYKCSNVYNKESEGGIIWNDPTLDIDWLIDDDDIIISDKDSILPKFK
jgi:dTDP-4-dehydrorhamnose 3,5-epimerase